MKDELIPKHPLLQLKELGVEKVLRHGDLDHTKPLLDQITPEDKPYT